MEVLGRLDLDTTNERIAELRLHADLAQAYALAIRLDPKLAGGFGRLRAKHLAHVAALAVELTADARLIGVASVVR